jgi:hypothetical protein
MRPENQIMNDVDQFRRGHAGRMKTGRDHDVRIAGQRRGAVFDFPPEGAGGHRQHCPQGHLNVSSGEISTVSRLAVDPVPELMIQYERISRRSGGIDHGASHGIGIPGTARPLS